MQPPNSRTNRPAIIVLSSLVADGSVGGRLACFALERLGFPVWFVPTATLPRHPGRNPSVRANTSTEFLQGCLSDLSNLAESQGIAAVLTGYIGDADQISIVAQTISQMKETHPHLLYLCDPVLGDNDQLYVPQDTASAIRDELWTICDVATPNSFELRWLEHAVEESAIATSALANLARSASPQHIAVTSVSGMMTNHIGNLLAAPDAPAILFEHLAMPHAPHGTGDLFAALLLGHFLLADNWEVATERASSALFELTVRAAKAGLADLPLIAEQLSLERPMATISKRIITTANQGGSVNKDSKGKRPVLKPRPL